MIALPPTVNIHIFKPCNYHCRFCFAHFRDTGNGLDSETWANICRQLLAHGARKINFAGGEPTLYPELHALIELVQQAGATASIVTNGARLPQLLQKCRPDIVGLSIDSSSDGVNKQLGRGHGDHVSRTKVLAALVREKGLRLKINTVVTRLILDENMSDFIDALHPERWKLFQVLPIRGENDGEVEPLLITLDEFHRFVDRHRNLECKGIRVVPETNSDMTGSYAMIDPDGRFFDNTRGELRSSDPIPLIGVPAAWAQVNFSREKFNGRGGDYR